jgi:hypothetical protein
MNHLLRAFLVASVASTGVASANTGTYQGFTWTTEGAAAAIEVGTELVILGIGSTGNDGISIDLTSQVPSIATGCWALGLQQVALAPNAWIEIRTRGTIGTADALVAHERITGLPGGGVSLTFDESPLAPASSSTRASRSCVSVSTTATAGATLSSGATVVPSTPRVITFSTGSTSSTATGVNFVNAWSTGIPNWVSSSAAELDRVQITSTATVVPSAHTRIQIRASGVFTFSLTSLAATTVGAACDPRLIITKVVDGSLGVGGPNWVEITNVGAVALQMSNYTLGHFKAGDASMNNLAPISFGAYMLPAGQSYVLALEPPGSSGINSFQAVYGIAPTMQFDDADFDGSSALVLFKGTPPQANGAGGILVDRYGKPGDPGTTDPINFTRGYSGRVTSNPTTDFLESQWQFAGRDSLWMAQMSDAALGSLMQLQTLPGEYQGCGVGLPGPFCSGGSGSGCPCANFSQSGGCLNSFSSTSGALLRSFTSDGTNQTMDTYSASVTSDSNGIVALGLVADGLPPVVSCLFFQGTSRLNGGMGVAFGDGLRCVGGSVLRLGIKVATQGTAVYGGMETVLGYDTPISVRGLIPASGAKRHYQAWYRNAAAFCTLSTFNLSNALTVQWTL